MNEETGEVIELRSEHAGDAVRLFYAALPKGTGGPAEQSVYRHGESSYSAELVIGRSASPLERGEFAVGSGSDRLTE